MKIKHHKLIFVATDNEFKQALEELRKHTPYISDTLEQATAFILDTEYVVVRTGIGKVAAAVTATRILAQNDAWDEIINVGLAGGKGFKKGTIVQIGEVHNEDYSEAPFSYVKYYLTVDEQWEDNKLYTQDHIETGATSEHIEEGIFDMEGYAIAAAYQDHYFPHMETEAPPLTILKVISDEVNTDTQADDYNAEENDELLQKAFKQIITNGGIRDMRFTPHMFNTERVQEFHINKEDTIQLPIKDGFYLFDSQHFAAQLPELVDLWIKEHGDWARQFVAIFVPEAKGVVLAAYVGARLGIPVYPINKERKSYHTYDTVKFESITGGAKELYIRWDAIYDIPIREKVLVFDDVISTGGTVNAIIAKLAESHIEAEAAAIFREGHEKANGIWAHTLMNIPLIAKGGK